MLCDTTIETVSVTGLKLSEPCFESECKGTSISLQCNVEGFPRPSIVFHLNATPITTTSKVGIYENYVIQEFYNRVSTNPPAKVTVL